MLETPLPRDRAPRKHYNYNEVNLFNPIRLEPFGLFLRPGGGPPALCKIFGAPMKQYLLGIFLIG